MASILARTLLELPAHLPGNVTGTVYRSLNCDGYNPVNLNLFCFVRASDDLDMELTLAKGSLHCSGNLACVEVLEGTLWVTVGDGGKDLVLTTGHCRGFVLGSHVVIEALSSARIRLHGGSKASPKAAFEFLCAQL